MGEVLRIKTEQAIGKVGSLEVTDINRCPAFGGLVAYLRWRVRLLAYGKIHLLNRLLARCRQVYHEVAVLLLHRIVVAVFIHVDEVVGIDGSQLRFRWIRYVDLIVVLHVGPLRLAVKPNGGLSSGGMKLLALDGYGAAGIHILPVNGKVCLSTRLV